jgi:acetyltransferase-like isoleucine patch superfamily enzyme
MEKPEKVMRRVTEDMILRAIRLSVRKRRPVYISKSARGKGVDVTTLDPRTEDGRKNLDAFFASVKRIYTFYGLGKPEEPNAINWRHINLPLRRRVLLQLQVAFSLVLKGTPFKNRLYRRMGYHIGENVEIMQMAWLDHYRPELIFIGDNTLIGAYTHITVHGYEGAGRFRYGLVEIGSNCTIGAGTGIGPIRIEDNVRTLPGTIVSPYFTRIRAGSIVGFNPPPVKVPETEEPGQNVSNNAAADEKPI